MLLEPEGYDLHFCEDGRHAIEFAKENKPDLILLDLMMPEVDGYEVCRTIRKDDTIRDIPVFLITAVDDREAALRGIRAGADDFISKPYDRAALRVKIQNVAALNRYRKATNARARFVWLAERTTDALLMVDESDRIVYANDPARVYFPLLESSVSDSQQFLEVASQIFTLEPEELWKDWPDELPMDQSKARYLVIRESDQQGILRLEVSVLPQHEPEASYLILLRVIT